jgi:hypothetical protein
VITPGRRGAGLPEKRLHAKSILPQKKCTGLVLPTNLARNRSSTFALTTRIRQKLLAYFGIVRAMCVVLVKRNRVSHFLGVLVYLHRNAE